MKRWWSRLFRAAPSPGAADDGTEALLREGHALRLSGDVDKAGECYRRILADDPSHEAALGALVTLLSEEADAHRTAGRLEEALACCEEAVALSPGLAPLHNNLGNAYRALQRREEAAACFRDALRLEPQQPEANFNLAVALHEGGARADAAVHYRAAIAAQPGFAEARFNLGHLLDQEGDWSAAEACYRETLALVPEDADAHFNLALNLLGGGAYAEGWREYEWRLRKPALAPLWPFQDRPRWDGGPLEGRTILLYAEQGFGDALQFVRYVPQVARRGGRVLLACQPKLRDLFARMPEVSQAFSGGDPVPPSDLCCSLLSLPRLFGTTLESIPAEIPYLRPDPARARAWQARLAADPSPLKVGLFWATESQISIAAQKSMTLAALAPLAQVPGVAFYSLQRGPAAQEAARPPQGMTIVDPGAALADFSDDAALMANLDLVISIDSATAHLAGALGTPAWTLIHHPGEWRWLRGRDDSPWYPGMRLFRQRRAGEWDPVLRELAEALAALAGARRPAA